MAKQYWRLIQNPHSFYAQVMGVKYFPRRSLMEATIGFRPSYLWRSLLEARFLLMEGMGWRIGNGEYVHIWSDKWITRVAGMKPLIPYNNRVESMVATLIDTD